MEEKDLQGQEQTDLQQQQQQEEKIETFTKEEVEKMLQSESDKRVSKALDTAKAKWQEEFQAKLEQEKSEAEKLAKMSASERLQAELDAEKAKFETERKQFMQEKLELQTVKELSAVGLPTDFSTFVMADNAEAIKANITSLKLQFETAIEKAVEDKLKGHTPKTATKTGGATFTKEQFSKMTYKEKMEIYNTDKELYDQLKG
jgi:hypothetical protein